MASPFVAGNRVIVTSQKSEYRNHTGRLMTNADAQDMHCIRIDGFAYGRTCAHYPKIHYGELDQQVDTRTPPLEYPDNP